jgi:hypothetical protein
MTLQTRCERAKDEIMYIMLTRAVKGCALWLHTEPLGYPGAQLTDDHADDDELSQHEKLVALTAHIRIHVAVAPPTRRG